MSRLHYLDYIKGFAILLVVLGHVHTVEPLFMWYESFYMPIFFAVSGILIAYKEQKNGALTFSLKKTARGILLPYFTFSLLYMALIFLIDALGGTLTGDIVWQYVVDLFVFKGVSVNWFLLMLFFGECLFYLLRRFLRRDWLFVAVTLVLLVGAYFVWQMPAPWKYACRIFVAQSFIVFGYYFYKLVLNNTAKWAAVCRSWGFVIALMAVQVVTSQLLRDNIHGIYLTNGVLGSAAYILFFYKLNHVNIPPLRFFGQNSLIVMGTHMLFVEVLKLCDHVLLHDLIGTSPFAGVFFFVITIALELPTIWIFNHWLWWAIGKNPLQKAAKGRTM